MKLILCGISIILFISCSDTSEQKIDDIIFSEQTEIDTTYQDKTDSIKINEASSFLWLSDNYEPYLEFPQSEESVWIVFSGQCMYKYPIEKRDNIILVKYDTIMDCVYDLGFRQDIDVNTPQVGDAFIELKQENDTIFAKYLFQDWKDSLNARYPSNPIFMESFVRTDLSAP